MNQEFSHEKIFWAHEIPTRKNFGPTKYPREKIWTDEGNTHEKKFRTRKIPTRLSFGPTKYPQRQDGTISLDPGHSRWH